MIAKSLLSILCCPETRQALRPAEATLIATLNEKVRSGSLQNRAGKPIASPIDEGLLREDGKILYPIRNSIPVMLVDESIPIH